MRILTKLLPPFLQPYAGRLALTLLGLVTAILMLTIGFWRTLLLLVLAGVGYLLGKLADGALELDRLPLIDRFL